jgi:hypothetical protein
VPKTCIGRGESGSPPTCTDCATVSQTCLEQPCAAEWKACQFKPGCQKLASCLQDCGGTAVCAASCEKAMGAVGVGPVWQPLAACSAKLGCGKGCGNGTCEPMETTGNCPADCKLATAGNGLCEVGENPYLPCNGDCGRLDVIGCQKALCPAEWAACSKDAKCVADIACVQQCAIEDDGCMANCLGTYDPQSPLYVFLGCGGKTCNPGLEQPCGDGDCDSKCPADCVPSGSCGDGICQAKETANSCAKDCKATASIGECASALCAQPLANCLAVPGCATAWSCVEKCETAANFKSCSQACTGATALLAYWDYMTLGQCVFGHGCAPEAAAGCGDHKCAAGETEENCPEDCFEPDQCGDNYCSSKEDKASCAQDCATCQDTGCGEKPGLTCCPVSGKWECTGSQSCDL